MSEERDTQEDKATEVLISFRKISEKQLEDLAKSFAGLVTKIKPIYESMGFLSKQISQLYLQYKTAFSEGINNFEPPKMYDPAKTNLHPWTEKLATREGFELLDQLETGSFSFMFERYRKGFEAYLKKEYQLSTFTFVSMIDGMIRQFYEMHKGIDLPNTSKRPSFSDGLNHLKKHYKMDIFVGKPEFENRLRAFFEHRNEIMHGGRFSYFDKNISTIALLFLTVTFTSISEVKFV